MLPDIKILELFQVISYSVINLYEYAIYSDVYALLKNLIENQN